MPTGSLRLKLAGLELIETSSGDWYCLEANTNPGFSYYDVDGNEAVAQAIADLLMGR